MAMTSLPQTSRWTSTAVLVVAMLLLVGFAMVRGGDHTAANDPGHRRQNEAQLQERIQSWEDMITGQVVGWLTELPDATDLTALEETRRAETEWFDAWYLWRWDAEEPHILYPSAPLTDDVPTLLRRTPCMRQAHALRVVGKKSKAADAFAGCMTGTVAEQLLASDLAASQMVAEGRASAAVELLNNASPPIRNTLRQSIAEGLDPQRLVHRRTTLGSALALTGAGSERVTLLRTTVEEVCDLSGPSLNSLLPEARRLLERELLGGITPAETARLRARLERAERRAAGYVEVRDRLSKVPAARNDDSPLELGIVHDTYSQSGFLLVWAALGRDRVGAIHLDTESLLAALTGDADERDASRMAVLDAESHLVRPRNLASEDLRVGAAVSLGRMLPHLRLARLTADVARRPAGGIRTVLELAPVLIALVLAAVSIIFQQTAARRERELYTRQQDFIARVSHELKTPLAGIKVMAETLEMGAASDPATLQRFLRRILQETDTLEQRIDEVLVAAREPTVSATTPVELHVLVEEVLESWRPRFAQAGAAIEADLKVCPAVPADPELLRDAVSNLLDNALKYRREGTRGLAQLRTGVMGRWVVFEIADNGIGVPPSMRKAIFERFQRVEGHGRGKAGGHGLGLAFVADTAAAHGGLIECSEGLDGGARFRLKLRRET